MNKLFNLDSPIMCFLSRVCDLMILNLFFVLTCIPLVTIGASLTALYSVALKMVKNEETYVSKDYFKAFFSNFKQGTVIWIISVIAGTILYMDYQIVKTMNFAGSHAVKTGVISICVLCFCMFTYVFPILARFVNTVRGTIRNSLLMCIAHLPYTILFLAIYAVLVVIAIQSAYLLYLTFFILMIGGTAAIAYVQCIFFRKIFKIYEPEEAHPELEEQTELEEDTTTDTEM